MTCKKGLFSHKENYEFNYLNITLFIANRSTGNKRLILYHVLKIYFLINFFNSDCLNKIININYSLSLSISLIIEAFNLITNNQPTSNQNNTQKIKFACSK